VLDWAKAYGVPAAVFRMSCIYGPHQHGNEDQGWVAHFLRRALAGESVTVYGDGAQVRDVLYVGDLIEALLLARERIGYLAGRPFNVGGGPTNTLSLLELADLIEELHGRRPELVFAEERHGDQRWYVSDTTSLRAATGWMPHICPADGVALLLRWLAPAEAVTA
jgi:CDP-paratose 2-epimerase